VCQLFIASLSHIFGRCELLLISELLFAAGTAIVCSAHGIAQLLVGRSIQGIGGGGIVALVQVVFTDIIPLRHRPKYLGYLQVASALGTVSGPLVGGAVSQYSTWRWIFYINFPFCLGGLITLPLGLKFQQFETSFASRLLLIDWFGGFLFTASATSFLMALSWGGVQFPWGDFHTLVPLIVGLVGVGMALVWEAYGTKEPFLKLSVFNSRSAAAAQICSFAQGFLVSTLDSFPFPFSFFNPLTLSSAHGPTLLYPILF
jgi:MFS family permease